MKLRQAFARLLPLFAIIVFVLGIAATLAAAGETLGYDFKAYHAAASPGPQGPVSIRPFVRSRRGLRAVLLSPDVPAVRPAVRAASRRRPRPSHGLHSCSRAFLAALLVMPIMTRTRCWILLVAGLSWPVVYNIKLGQVGPLLLLLFAVAWRGLDRPWVFGIASALGTGVKVQPGILLGWAILRRRWHAALAVIVSLIVLVAIATHWSGPMRGPSSGRLSRG